MKRPFLLAPIILGAMLLSGCASIQRAWNALVTPARAQAEIPVPQPSPWVRLDSPSNPPAAPALPAAHSAGGGQADGLAILIQELDHVARLVDRVSRMPPEPGEFRVNYIRIQADLGAVRAGLVEALLQPHAAPRDYPPIQRDYLE